MRYAARGSTGPAPRISMRRNAIESDGRVGAPPPAVVSAAVVSAADDASPRIHGGRATGGIALLVALIVVGDAFFLGLSTPAGRALAVGCTGDAALIERLRADDTEVAAEAAQALYDRLRAGALDDAALVAVARAMWSARACADDRPAAGRDLPISLQLQSPGVVDGDFADGRPGPVIEWRLAAVEIVDPATSAVRASLPLAGAVATRTPLTKFAPTVWCHAAVPASTPLGRATLRLTVDLAVRASPAGPTVGRWTLRTTQTVEIVDATAADR